MKSASNNTENLYHIATQFHNRYEDTDVYYLYYCSVDKSLYMGEWTDRGACPAQRERKSVEEAIEEGIFTYDDVRDAIIEETSADTLFIPAPSVLNGYSWRYNIPCKVNAKRGFKGDAIFCGFSSDFFAMVKDLEGTYHKINQTHYIDLKEAEEAANKRVKDIIYSMDSKLFVNKVEHSWTVSRHDPYNDYCKRHSLFNKLIEYLHNVLYKSGCSDSQMDEIVQFLREDSKKKEDARNDRRCVKKYKELLEWARGKFADKPAEEQESIARKVLWKQGYRHSAGFDFAI